MRFGRDVKMNLTILTKILSILYTKTMKGKLALYLSFFLGIILVGNVATTHAQEITLTPTPVQNTLVFVKYDLAFPGMLPDNQLYKLKVLRDKIIAASIFNPLKKIDFYVLQADKGILATAMLIDKNKIDLAQTTALKAENNFTLISTQLYLLAKKPNKDFFKRLETAGLKHQEVLRSIIKRVPKDKQKIFMEVIGFSERNLDTIEEYRTQQ